MDYTGRACVLTLSGDICTLLRSTDNPKEQEEGVGCGREGQGGGRRFTLSRNHSGRQPRPSIRIRILVKGAMSRISMRKVSFCSRSNLGVDSRGMQRELALVRGPGRATDQLQGREGTGFLSPSLSFHWLPRSLLLHPRCVPKILASASVTGRNGPDSRLASSGSSAHPASCLSSPTSLWDSVSSAVVWGERRGPCGLTEVSQGQWM